MKNWLSILMILLVGCGSLAVIGWGVSRFLSVTTVNANAQEPSTVESPLPEPEDIAIEPPPEVAAEENESGSLAPEKINLGILEGIIEEYDYMGQDKRDPFAPFIVPQIQSPGKPVGPVTELERYDLEQLRLVGIIWGVTKPKALFLDPNQKTYVVYNKTRIGRNSGYIAEIREGEVVVIEAFNNEGRYSYQPRILKLQRE